MDGDGYETFHLTIKTADTAPLLALSVGQIYTSFKLFVNGKQRISSGAPGKTPKSSLPGMGSDFTHLDDTTENKIVIHVSNFSHHRRGIGSPIRIDTYENIKTAYYVKKLYDIFLIGAITTFCFTSFSLFVYYKKDRSNLLFSLACLQIIIYLILYRSNVSSDSWFIWFFYVRLLHFVTTLFPLIILLFLKSLFGQILPKVIENSVSLIVVVLLLADIFAPIKILGKYVLPAYLVFLFFIIILVHYIIIRTSINRMPGARVLLVAAVFFSVTFLFDSLFHYRLIDTQVKLVPSGLFFMLFAISTVISKKFSNSFYNIEKKEQEIRNYASKISELNEQLINRIINKSNIGDIIHLYNKLDTIDYIKSEGRYSRIQGSEKLLNVSLKQFDLLFPDSVLIRVRRNTLVNPKKIEAIMKKENSCYEIVTKTGTHIVIGSSYLKKVRMNLSSQFPA